MRPELSAATSVSSRPPIKILVADGHVMIRKIVTSSLEQEAGFEVVGEAENGLEAVRKAEALKPNVVILNVTMPVLDGFEAARQIRKKLPEVAIVILSSKENRSASVCSEKRSGGGVGEGGRGGYTERRLFHHGMNSRNESAQIVSLAFLFR